MTAGAFAVIDPYGLNHREIFGPILPIIEVEDTQEAIRIVSER